MLALDASGGPGTATDADSRCVFCSGERFEKLTRVRGGSLVTNYLRRLRSPERKEALAAVEVHAGASTRRDYEMRLARRQRRRDPNRPKRKARGSYIKKRRSVKEAWGIPGAAMATGERSSETKNKKTERPNTSAHHTRSKRVKERTEGKTTQTEKQI